MDFLTLGSSKLLGKHDLRIGLWLWGPPSCCLHRCYLLLRVKKRQHALLSLISIFIKPAEHKVNIYIALPSLLWPSQGLRVGQRSCPQKQALIVKVLLVNKVKLYPVILIAYEDYMGV